MFRRILIWFGAMVAFSFPAFLLTSFFSSRDPFRAQPMRRLARYQFEECIRAYEAGGAPQLSRTLESIDRNFPARHHLLDRQGRDLATGADLSALAGKAFSGRPPLPLPLPFPQRGPLVFKLASPDGRYVFLAAVSSRFDPWANLGIYGWIVLVIVLLCYALAWTLARPIRQLSDTVTRFGRGELESRSRSRRHDELGDLSRAFDQMADRIQTLLTAERRLLQDISHELRSPLARLRFALELARSSPDPRSSLDRVNREVERLASLIGELLQVTRAEGDPESRNVAPLDLAQFLAALVEECRIEAEAHGCRIHIACSAPVIWSGDRELLRRAIENILRNAIRYSPVGSTIEVCLSSLEHEIHIGVRDFGPGVPEPDLPNIFQPFFRVEEDRSRENGGGAGLGLAIAQRAVRLHHGEISAANMHPGLQVNLRLHR